MTTFSILEFPRTEGAVYMLRTLQKLQEQHIIQIEDGAILIWPLGSRKPRIKQLRHLSGVDTLSGAFWGLLVGLLFAVPFFGMATGTVIGTLAGHFARYGLDEHFINGVRNQITEGTSALFLMTTGAVMDKVVTSIKGMPFEIISTSLTLEQEALLREAFGESSRAEIPTDWREEYAYTLGLQAYIYGFPWAFLSQLRWQWATQPVDPGKTPYAAINHFWHARALMDATYQTGRYPDNDTMFSVAWVNVREEPVILSHPDMGERYFTFQLASLDSDNFAYVGTRSTGQCAGHYAIVGPGWQGRLPPDVQVLQPSRTPTVLIFGRTMVDGPQDLTNVQALQKHYRLTPLRLWNRPGTPVPEEHTFWPPFDAATDPLAVWKTMNRAMTEEPPEARHDVLLKLFATIGVGPNQHVELMDASTQRGLARAAATGSQFNEAVFNQGGSGKRVNGWRYPPPTIGRAGLHDDFVTRAALQCAAIIAPDPQEAVHFVLERDSDDQPLSGMRHYCLRFTPYGLPKVSAFWSITMYSADHNLVENPIDRYSIGSRTSEVVHDPDGGLTLFIQNEPPEDDRVLNWLPAPRGQFNLILRTYLPAREIVEQTWQPPALEPLPRVTSQRQKKAIIARKETNHFSEK
ncbi:MAG TPA: DUF1254 domain-containing protein [Ktedonobacteraceae bacterium]|nr:DUF1254 domain-containing protein [Ktedonobacteraceae bacterium]